MYGKVTYTPPESEIKQLSSDFADNVSIELLVKRTFQWQAKLIDATNSKIEIILIEESLRIFLSISFLKKREFCFLEYIYYRSKSWEDVIF